MLLTAIVCLAGLLSAQDESVDAPSELWSARYANSQKDYAEAVRRTDRIRALDRVGNELLCDALLHAFYAHHHLGAEAEADRALAAFEAGQVSLPESSTLRSEMRDLLLHLGIEHEILTASTSTEAFRPAQDDDWPIADPVDVGLDQKALEAHAEYERQTGADAYLVAYRGQIVSEWYSDRYRVPMMTMSSVKSITALVAGQLITDGKIGSVDDPVSRYLPSWSAGKRAKVTLRHLLTMTAGLPGKPSVGFSREKNAFVIGLKPEINPGERWAYSNEEAQLLSPVLEAAAGEPLADYARRRLFEPLGMKHTTLRVSGGDTWTYADATTSLRDFARFGVVMETGGRWNDAQVLSEAWVQACLTPGPMNASYGYLWWLETEPKSYSMRGYLNTSVYVLPELDLVLARMQKKPYLHTTKDFQLAEIEKLLTAVVGK